VSTVAEATRTAAPAARTRWLRRSPVGRFVRKAPFWLLILAIFVYALFPFYWAIRSSFTPDGELFNTPIDYWPKHPTLANYREALAREPRSPATHRNIGDVHQRLGATAEASKEYAPEEPPPLQPLPRSG
jgi:ABC-type glycerol-3-phosphate transport system permease component